MYRQAAIDQHLKNTHVYVRDRDDEGLPIVRELSAENCRSTFEEAHRDRVMQEVKEQLEALPDKVLTATAEGKHFDGEKAKKPLSILVFEGDETGLSPAEKLVVYKNDFVANPVQTTAEKRRGSGSDLARSMLSQLGLEHEKGAQWISNDIYDVTKRLAPEWSESKGLILINNKQRNISEAIGKVDYKPVIGQMMEAYMDSLPSDKSRELSQGFDRALKRDMAMWPGVIRHRTYLASMANGDAAVRTNVQNDGDGRQTLQVKLDLNGMLPVAVQALCGGVRIGDKQPFRWNYCPNMIGYLVTEFPDLMESARAVAPKATAEWQEFEQVRQKIGRAGAQNTEKSWAEKTAPSPESPRTR